MEEDQTATMAEQAPQQDVDEFGVPKFGSTMDAGILRQMLAAKTAEQMNERISYESYISGLKNRIRELEAGAAPAEPKAARSTLPTFDEMKARELESAYVRIQELERANADMRSQLGAPPPADDEPPIRFAMAPEPSVEEPEPEPRRSRR